MIYDITPPISENLAVWPGDTPMSREVLCEIESAQAAVDTAEGGAGDGLAGGHSSAQPSGGPAFTLSTLRATVHLGAHADAPSHYAAGAESIDRCSLDYYLGPCQVISVKVARGACIEPEALEVPIHAPRVLFATGTYPNPNVFNEDFAALSPALVETLAQSQVKLIGIDTPSVDPFRSKDLPAHKALLKHDMANLEGLVLRDVPDGLYELIALPLRLVGFDGSPVRAVLRTRE